MLAPPVYHLTLTSDNVPEAVDSTAENGGDRVAAMVKKKQKTHHAGLQAMLGVLLVATVIYVSAHSFLHPSPSKVLGATVSDPTKCADGTMQTYIGNVKKCVQCDPAIEGGMKGCDVQVEILKKNNPEGYNDWRQCNEAVCVNYQCKSNPIREKQTCTSSNQQAQSAFCETQTKPYKDGTERQLGVCAPVECSQGIEGDAQCEVQFRKSLGDAYDFQKQCNAAKCIEHKCVYKADLRLTCDAQKEHTGDDICVNHENALGVCRGLPCPSNQHVVANTCKCKNNGEMPNCVFVYPVNAGSIPAHCTEDGLCVPNSDLLTSSAVPLSQVGNDPNAGYSPITKGVLQVQGIPKTTTPSNRPGNTIPNPPKTKDPEKDKWCTICINITPTNANENARHACGYPASRVFRISKDQNCSDTAGGVDYSWCQSAPPIASCPGTLCKEPERLAIEAGCNSCPSLGHGSALNALNPYKIFSLGTHNIRGYVYESACDKNFCTFTPAPSINNILPKEILGGSCAPRTDICNNPLCPIAINPY